MPNPITRKQCRHIRTSGLRCGAASLRDGNFCYYHQRARNPGPEYRGVNPKDAEFDLPPIEDRPSMLFAISQIMARITTNTLDARRAGLLLYSIQIASKMLPPQPRYTPQPYDPAAEARELAALANLVDEFESDPILGPMAPIADLPDPPELAGSPSSVLRSTNNGARTTDNAARTTNHAAPHEILPGSPEDPTPDPYGDRAFLRKAIDESRAAREAGALPPLEPRIPTPDPKLNPDFYTDPARFGYPELANFANAARIAAQAAKDPTP